VSCDAPSPAHPIAATNTAATRIRPLEVRMCTSSLSLGTVSSTRLGEREYLAAYFDEAGGRCGREAQERTFSIHEMARCSRGFAISAAFRSLARSAYGWSIDVYETPVYNPRDASRLQCALGLRWTRTGSNDAAEGRWEGDEADGAPTNR